MSKKPKTSIFPDIDQSIANQAEISRAMLHGTMFVEVDHARDGTETTIEGYKDPATGVLIITDELFDEGDRKADKGHGK